MIVAARRAQISRKEYRHQDRSGQSIGLTPVTPAVPQPSDVTSSSACGQDHGGVFMMMDMTTMSTGMMVGMGIYHLIIVIFALLGIAAFIKYLRS
jgi:hypothetical protein